MPAMGTGRTACGPSQSRTVRLRPAASHSESAEPIDGSQSPTSHWLSTTAGAGASLAARSAGRPSASQGADRTASNPSASAWQRAAASPPSGPRPGAGRSASPGKPPHCRPDKTRDPTCGRRASATWAISGLPPSMCSALSAPKRRDRPPARMTPSSLRRFPRTARARSGSGGSPRCRRRFHRAWHRGAAGRSDSR
jgi:hypothetical protein